jgi:hypothetical protein
VAGAGKIVGTGCCLLFAGIGGRLVMTQTTDPDSVIPWWFVTVGRGGGSGGGGGGRAEAAKATRGHHRQDQAAQEPTPPGHCRASPAGHGG